MFQRRMGKKSNEQTERYREVISMYYDWMKDMPIVVSSKER